MQPLFGLTSDPLVHDRRLGMVPVAETGFSVQDGRSKGSDSSIDLDEVREPAHIGPSGSADWFWSWSLRQLLT